MTYAEMLEQPTITITTPEGVIVCSRNLSQLTTVIQAIENQGIVFSRPKTLGRIQEKYQGLGSRDSEGGPSTLFLRSVMPPRERYERAGRQQSRSMRWPEVPGSAILWDLLTEDEMRLLKFTLNSQQSLFVKFKSKSGDSIKQPFEGADGFAAYSATLVTFLGENL